MDFQKIFYQPPVKNRIKPFWFWNGEMREEEIDRQLEEMALKGLGGAFICARQGLTIPYLSKAWFERVGYACKKAKEMGLEVWLYDEYPYPSGMSGGEVTLRCRDAEHMILKHERFFAAEAETIEKQLDFGEILCAKAFPVFENGTLDYENAIDLEDCIGNLQTEEIYQETGLTAYNNKRYFTYNPTHILRCTLPKRSGRSRYCIEVIWQEPMGEFKYYGKFFDPCNKKAVQCFLETTHEKYKKYLGDGFGENIFGMFSDEVGLLSRIPWSETVFSYFKENTGEDLHPLLPALYDKEFPRAMEIRYAYMQSIHLAFLESYHKQVGKWCRDNHLLYATEVPSMRMTTQKYSDVVGGDTAHEKLGKELEWIYDKYLPNYRSNSKSVVSLARQLNKSYRMIESFHSVGWSMTLQDAKWMIDNLGINGINLFNFHAFYYTTASLAKHDAPPSQFIQNPYWKYYRILSDYVGRMSVFNTYTELDNQIAVLDPVPSLFTKLANPFHRFSYAGEDEKEKEACEEIAANWTEVCKTILFEQLNYDHLDGEVLKTAQIEADRLKIGRACYRILVISPCDCVEADTTDMLEKFADAGGSIILLGTLPSVVIDRDRKVRERYERLLSRRGVFFIQFEGSFKKEEEKKKELIALLKKLLSSDIEFEIQKGSKKSCMTSLRIGENQERFIMIANQGKDPIQGVVHVNSNEWKGARFYCFETGEIRNAQIQNTDAADEAERRNYMGIPISLAAFESVCVELTKEKTAEEKKSPQKIYQADTAKRARVTIEGDNVFRLAVFEMSLNGKEWKETEVKTFIEQVSETKLIQKESITYEGQFGIPKKMQIRYPLKAAYRQNFIINGEVGDIWILLEKGTIEGEHSIFINGKKPEEQKWEPCFVTDISNKKCCITDYLRQGKNEILIEVLVKRNFDGVRDPIYLIGDFGVAKKDGSMAIVKKPEEAGYRETYTEGFPYFSGTTDFLWEIDASEKDIETELLQFDFQDSRFDCMEVFLNGHRLGVRAYTPYRFEIPRGIWHIGKNQLLLKVTNSLSNMFDGMYFDYKEHRLVKIE